MLLPGDSLLQSSPPPGPSSLDSQLLQACEELETLLRSGQSARAEELLARHPSLTEDPERALDLIYVEYAVRRELGDTPAPDEYLGRFPQWRDHLRRQFQLDELLDEGAPLPKQPEIRATAASAHQSASSTGRFRIQSPLASGGIGQVMRALDTELHREVAVKEIQPALAGSQEVRARFLREAEITGQLEHPGIVPVYGMGRDASERPFYAMRLVRGQTLQQAVQEFHDRSRDGRRFFGLEFQKLLRRFLHVCQTVAYAHSRGVIHRDLKPDNILLGPFGETLVVDWGLAKVTAADDLHPAQPPSPGAEQHADAKEFGTPSVSLSHLSGELTRDAGEWIGTPAYMSPEQALGQAHRVGPAGDVYSLGATLYMLLTGQAPIVGANVDEALRRVIAGHFAPPRELSRAIPPPLQAICLKAMARRPEDRYASPNDLADDLERWLADEPVTAARDTIVAKLARWGRRHRTRVVAAALALVTVTVVSLAAAVMINGERLRTEQQRIEADRRTARLAFDRGYALTEAHEYGPGILWFARALSHTPQDDAPMRRVILTNIDAARQHLLHRRRTFEHQALLAAAAFDADGSQVATGDHRGNLRLWNLESGELLAERRPGPVGRTLCARVAGGTATFAVISGQSLYLETVEDSAGPTGQPIKFPVIEEVACAAFSHDGDTLVTGSRSAGPSKVRLFQVHGGKQLLELDHPRTVTQVVFRPNRDLVATVCEDGRMRVWDLKGARMELEIKPETGRVERIAYTPDGERVLVGDSQGIVSCFDADSGERQFELARGSGRVIAVACHADGNAIAAAWSSGTARCFQLADRRPVGELLRTDRHAGVLTFHPQARQMLIASEPESAVLWDISDPSQVGAPLPLGLVSAVAFSPDGQSALIGSRTGTAQLCDAATGRPAGKPMVHRGAVKCVAFRPGGEVVLTGSYDGTARLWSAVTGEPTGGVMDHRSGRVSVQVESAAFSPDGRLVLTGDNRGAIRVWDARTGAPIRQLAARNGSVLSLAFSRGGDRVVAGCGAPDSGVHLWEISSGKLLWSAQHADTVRKVAISPDGSLVLSAGNDRTARLWHAADGRQACPPLPHRGEVFVVAFSPIGRLAMTGGYDATVRLWEIPSGRLVGEPMRHEGVVVAAEFSTDGRTLITGGSLDRSARLWDVTTSLPLSPPLWHKDEVAAVALHPTGRIAGTGRLWNLPVPLPDETALLDLWVKLATQRTFAAGDDIEWLRPEEVAAAASEFLARTGKPWNQWAN